MNELVTKTESQPTGINPLVAQALKTDIDPEKLDKLLALQERYEANEAAKAFNVSMTRARGQFKVAKQSGYNPQLENFYSKLVDLDEAVREALSGNGLSYRFIPSTPENNIIRIECVVSHELGHAERGSLEYQSDANTNKAVNALQSARSVSTYLKGMLLSSMLGIMSGDELEDDGVGSGAPPTQQALITEEQAMTITAFIDENDFDADKWLDYFERHFGSRNIGSIPAPMYEKVMSNLNKALEKAKGDQR